MSFYKKRIVKLDTVNDIAERIAYRKASEQAVKDREVKFPNLTSENFQQVYAYQSMRTNEIMQQMGK